MVNAGEVELDEQLAEEAKSIVALAFRNGPIEDIHAGRECPTCAGKAEYSHITQDEMKRMMKRAVDKTYGLLWIREYHPKQFEEVVRAGSVYTRGWDPPERIEEDLELMLRMAHLISTAKRTDAPGKELAKHKRKPKPQC